MRTAATALLALLLVAALFWGNCLSCPQMRLADAHRCCPENQKPVKSDCRNDVLQHFVKADAQKVDSAGAVTGTVEPLSTPVTLAVSVELQRPLAAVHAPPDRQAVLSSFLI